MLSNGNPINTASTQGVRTPPFPAEPESPAHGVHLLDPQTSIRNLLRHYLETDGCCVAGESASAREALTTFEWNPPQLLITDVALCDMGPLPFIQRVRASYPATRILLFPSWNHPDILHPLVDAGVHGLVFRESPLEALGRAVTTLLDGGCYLFLPPALSRRSPQALTEREMTALRLIAEGFSTKEMAPEMGITFKTAEKYRERVMQKLNLHDAVRLTRFAIRAGLVSP